MDNPYDRLKPFVALRRNPGANTYGIAPEKWLKMTAREKQRLRHRAYMARLRDDPAAYAAYLAAIRQRRQENVEVNELHKARNRAYKRANREAMNAYNREYHKRKGSKQQLEQNPELVFQSVALAIPRALPKHVRDDLAGMIYLDILEKRASLDNLDGLVAAAMTRLNRTMETFRTRSLDAPIAGTDGLTMLDVIEATHG